MDVLLIDPPYMSLKGIATDCGYNAGLTSLAAYLRGHNIDTGILAGDLLLKLSDKRWTNYDFKVYAAAQQDYEQTVADSNHPVWKSLAAYIGQTKPVLIGIAYYTPLQYVVEKVIRLVKDVNRDIKIVAGAFHPTFCPDEVMANKDVDFLIRGEGEIPLLHLAKEIIRGSSRWAEIPGIYYRDADGTVRNTKSPELIEKLDDLPFMARDAVINCDFNIYRDHCMISTRGCPYLCSFCGDKGLWGGRVRRRSVASMIAELKMLASKYKINQVDMVDGTFTFDKKYVIEFCNALIHNGIDINWRCTARYDNLDESLLKLLRKAHCQGFYFGLESGSNRILASVQKKFSVADIIRIDNMVYEHGFFSATSVLLGLPDETKEDMHQTLELMRRVKTTIFDVNSYVPLPGTPLYNAMAPQERENIDWRKVAMKSLNNHFCKTMSLSEFREILLEAYEIANTAWSNNIMAKT